MKYDVVNLENGTYIDVVSQEHPLSSEGDGMDCIAACMENEVDCMILHDHSVSPDFFKLGTGLAGMVLGKLVTYRIRTALIVSNLELLEGRFGELAAESNRRNDFRVCRSRQEAEAWLFSRTN